jgi:hypothetical protein
MGFPEGWTDFEPQSTSSSSPSSSPSS